MKHLIKTAGFSDIHFGRKNNSDMHNQDCLDYITWFCDNVSSDSSIDSVIFLGDWFENRSTVDIKTINYSHTAAKMLNKLNRPIFFIVGNHDLYQRFTRDIYSTIIFDELKYFNVISKPTPSRELGPIGSLLVPYLFHEEYSSLRSYSKYPTWWGHFEFRGFTITGHNVKMAHGPEHSMFYDQKRIFSGHYHRRQIIDNVVYIGNTFPMDMGDAGDTARGMMTYEHESDKISFIDWKECPKYFKTVLSVMLEDVTFPPKSRVSCDVDVPIDFQEANIIKKTFQRKFNLRDFHLNEIVGLNEALSEEQDVIEVDATITTENLIIEMLKRIKSDQIDNDLLLRIYTAL